MQFQVPKRSAIKQEVDDVSAFSKIQLYIEPPDEDISLIEIEKLVKERLKILRSIEELKERHSFMSAAFKTEFEKVVTGAQPLFIGRCSTSRMVELSRKDVISHFLLRLACCIDSDKTFWFITQEIDLLKIRLHYAGSACLMTFLNQNNELRPEEVSAAEKQMLMEKLMHGNQLSPAEIESKIIYKMKFADCRELVRSKKVLLLKGFCYVTVNDMIHFLTQKLRLILSSTMNKSRTALSSLNEDDRLLPLLYKWVYADTAAAQQKSGDGSVLELNQVDQMASTCFPLCMKSIHNRLRSDHHLKFFARQQYGLFLKGAGLSLEDSVTFFRQEFAKRMDMDKFNKQYLYNIRHMYGKEGNRVDHKPMSCPTIILGNAPAAGDCHGCPFKHADVQSLTQRLASLQILPDRVKEIVKLATDHRYDFACTRTFEFTHGLSEGGLGRIITNPNDYFEYSKSYKGLKAAATKTE